MYHLFILFIVFKSVLLSNLETLTLDSEGNLYEIVSVETIYGKVIGKKVQLKSNNADTPEELYVRKYLGIPYAEPPIGNLRFKAPVEIKPWSEVYNAIEEPNSCFQPQRYGSKHKVSEDCLYLNVIVPDPVPLNASVMVYIYGGSFRVGSASNVNFERLAIDQNVIIVAMNYRLGSFGFMYLANEECPGNMGLRDQNMALKWVHDNIERFGGDPYSVTLFGHSAGSISVGHHLLNPNHQHLFQRAILQSGSPFTMFASDSKMKGLHKSAQVASVAGCSETLSNLTYAAECLRGANASSILMASMTLQSPQFPVIDNLYAFGPGSMKIGKEKQVLLGATSNDGGFLVRAVNQRPRNFPPSNLLKNIIQTFIPSLKPQIFDLIKYFYKDHCNEHSVFKEEKAAVRMVTDIVFTCSTNKLADALARNGLTTYMYQFLHRPRTSTKPEWIESDHTDELQFVFGLLSSTANDLEIQLSNQLMNYWGNFAKYGNPNKRIEMDVEENDESIVIYNAEQNTTESVVETWPQYTVERKGRLDINLLSSEQAFGAIQEEQCSFWNHIFPLLSML